MNIQYFEWYSIAIHSDNSYSAEFEVYAISSSVEI